MNVERKIDAYSYKSGIGVEIVRIRATERTIGLVASDRNWVVVIIIVLTPRRVKVKGERNKDRIYILCPTFVSFNSKFVMVLSLIPMVMHFHHQ